MYFINNGSPRCHDVASDKRDLFVQELCIKFVILL